MGDPSLLNPIILKSLKKDGFDCLVYKSEFHEFHCVRLEMINPLETEDFYSPFPFVGLVLQGFGCFSSGNEKTTLNEFQQFFIPAKLTFRFSNKEPFIVYLCGSW